MLDFVTVTYSREKWLQKLQARSFAKFVPENLVSSIHLILNEVDEPEVAFLSDFVQNQIIPEYGSHAPLVRVHLAKDITSQINLRGYDRQQVLKIRFVASLKSAAAIVLDSKNVMIRPISRSDFYNEAGTLKANFEDMKIHMFWKLVPTYDRLTGGSGEPEDSIFLATMTPFAMIPQYCAQMIAYVEDTSGQPFEAQFARESATKSEFLMYAAYLRNQVGPLETIYSRTAPLNWTVWPKHYPGAATLRGGLDKARAANKAMIGLHLRRVEGMPDDEVAAVSSYLNEIGLLPAGETVQLI